MFYESPPITQSMLWMYEAGPGSAVISSPGDTAILVILGI